MNTNTLQPEYAEIAEWFLLAWDNGDYDSIPTEIFILELVEKCQAAALKRDAEIAALKAELEAVKKNIQYCDEDTTYRNIGEFLDNNQPNVGDIFDLTEVAFIRKVSFKCVEVDGSIDALEIDAAMQSVTDSQTEGKAT